MNIKTCENFSFFKNKNLNFRLQNKFYIIFKNVKLQNVFSEKNQYLDSELKSVMKELLKS